MACGFCAMRGKRVYYVLSNRRGTVNLVYRMVVVDRTRSGITLRGR